MITVQMLISEDFNADSDQFSSEEFQALMEKVADKILESGNFDLDDFQDKFDLASDWLINASDEDKAALVESMS